MTASLMRVLVAVVLALAAHAKVAHPPTEEERRALVSQGAGLVQDEVIAANGASALLTAFDSGKLLVKTVEERAVANRYHVDVLEGYSIEVVRSDLESIGVTVLSSAPKVGEVLVHLTTTSQMAAIFDAKFPWLRWVEQSLMVASSEQGLPVVIDAEPFRVPPFGLDVIDGSPYDGKYWRVVSGAGVEVYVLDTGIDKNHSEIAGRVWEGRGFVDSETETTTHDWHGHGTHCAGTIAGTQVGVAPEAAVVPIKVMDDSGHGADSNIIAALEWLINEKETRDANGGGPRMVISASLGGSPSYTLDDAFNRASDAGIVVVVAAGNEDAPAEWFSPARAAKVITVGALDSGSNAATFSNYGSKVDIWAPGVRVLSAKANTVDELTYKDGTSMACPHVSGVVALLLSVHPEWTVDEVKEHLFTECMEDIPNEEIKGSTGKMLRTWAARGAQSGCAASGNQEAFSKWWGGVEGDCLVDENCISSPNYDTPWLNYAANDNCQAISRVEGRVISEHLETEAMIDVLTIDSQSYSGDYQTVDQTVSMGSVLTWSTDGKIQMRGWKVCIDTEPIWVVDYGLCTVHGPCLRTTNYSNGSSCRAHLLQDAVVNFTLLDIESEDALFINMVRQTEVVSEELHLQKHSSVMWQAGMSVGEQSGWELCIAGEWDSSPDYSWDSSTVRSLPTLVLVCAFFLLRR